VSGGPGSKRALHEITSLDMVGEARAVLPMRLNADALSDLVILRGKSNALSVAMTRPMATFSVTDTSSAGLGTLRQAILDANNSPGVDTITFDISPGGQQTIEPNPFLTEITEAVVIDGTSQPGFAGKPIIELSGRLAEFFGFRVTQGGGVVVRGLVINRFAISTVNSDGVAITFSGAGGNRVEGCFIGTDTRGSFALPNQDGIVIESPSNTIGGTEAPAGNLISGQLSGSFSGVEKVAGGKGIIISGESARENLVQGNRIGTDFTGTEPLGNSVGISISEAVNNTIGGTAANAGNLISGNGNQTLLSAGISVSNAVGTRVIGNKIGVDINGVSPVPNDGPGILWSFGSSGSLIARNTMAFNTDGILGGFGGEGNVITANSIHSNKRLGIDLAHSERREDLPGPGVTLNDRPGDPDDGPNRLQNFPFLVAVRDANGNCRIRGVLESAPNTAFRVEFFSNRERDPSGHGEGETFRGFIMVTTGPDGRVEFESAIASDAGPFVSATATDPDGNTSEFSPQVMLCPTTTVTTTADTGSGSLRIAIERGGVIDFDIPSTDSGFDSNTGTWKMLPQTPLPLVSKPTVIDGSSQPDTGGAATPPPRIIIDGAMFPSTSPALQFGPGSAGSVLTGVGFTNFRSFGAVIFNTTGVTISNASFTNNANGVGIFGASFNTLSNIIGSNNSGLGVVISNDGPFQGDLQEQYRGGTRNGFRRFQYSDHRQRFHRQCRRDRQEHLCRTGQQVHRKSLPATERARDRCGFRPGAQPCRGSFPDKRHADQQHSHPGRFSWQTQCDLHDRVLFQRRL
jgi:hypothetical protein